jgi:aminoglycoside 6-adenylyltransferase
MDKFAARISAWAAGQPAIRALIMVGSQARRDHPADEWSDLDIMTFVADFSPFLTGDSWLDPLGPRQLCVPYQAGDGEPERLVVFDGGAKVDFHFFAVAELAALVASQTLDDVYWRGYHVLIDKDGLAAALPPCPFAPPPCDPPAPEEFGRTVDLFWYSALQCAKTIRRRDLWCLKEGDGLFKAQLRQMIEWHARLIDGRDTWHAGRFMLEWADERTRAELEDVFGRFDAADSWRALLASIRLFRRLAGATAAALNIAYPQAMDAHIGGLIEQLQREDLPAA